MTFAGIQDQEEWALLDYDLDGKDVPWVAAAKGRRLSGAVDLKAPKARSLSSISLRFHREQVVMTAKLTHVAMGACAHGLAVAPSGQLPTRP